MYYLNFLAKSMREQMTWPVFCPKAFLATASTKEDLNKARMEGVMPKTKYYPPKFNKDTKVIVNLVVVISCCYFIFIFFRSILT